MYILYRIVMHQNQNNDNNILNIYILFYFDILSGGLEKLNYLLLCKAYYQPGIRPFVPEIWPNNVFNLSATYDLDL